MSYKHPFVCCKYPARKILPIHEANCKSKCLNSSSKSKCCELDCIYRDTGVVVDGVFNDQALLKLYENYLDDAGAGKYDQWMSVVEKSMKKCVELGRKVSEKANVFYIYFSLSVPKTDKLLICTIPEYVIDITDCLSLMNYLDCPTFLRTEECEKARSFVRSLDNCGKRVNGTVLIDHQYWDFKMMDPRTKKFL